ncbi:hypothetical protein SARI_00900 [Salmonella enterica subsp. arizonae serovar 62:z4,z23:-]|uniref:Uncharacterized protein n=1 Tax=Salmonella arizonae (strain ATCC BAA-731 / CDC346-86 / RSK2980) TaxID=41514 RepID=A9MLV2_SALAR|nr:hypothetical protein SARI_00900 [Salmonella enterica subsp. arizonae serovar 62:z4,z23:-]
MMRSFGSPSFGSGHWRSLFIASFSIIAWVTLSIFEAFDKKWIAHIISGGQRPPASVTVRRRCFHLLRLDVH